MNEKMEKINIMDRIYGRQNIPKKTIAGQKEEKYWGWIQTIESNEDFCLKKVFMREGSQSSMEYHIRKNETYIF